MDPNTVTIIGLIGVTSLINTLLNFLILLSIFSLMETYTRRHL